MRVLQDDVRWSTKRGKVDWVSRQNDKSKFFQDLNSRPGEVIQVGNRGARGIVRHYRKYHVLKYGKVFAEGNSVTCIHVSTLNAFAGLIGEKVDADFFIAMA